MHKSCLLNHFQHYASLRPQEIQFLESLEDRLLPYARNTKVWHEGSDASTFYVLRSGWAYSSRILKNGSRQVLDLFLPGDVIGLRELAYRHRLNAVHTITDAQLCPFPKSQLQTLFATSPALGQLLFALAAQGQGLLSERVINLGRRSARQRVAHLLVELSVRLEKRAITGDALPLSQTLLADLLGLSAVHINRTIRRLREEGLIDLNYQTIRLLNTEALREIAGFNPAYLIEEFTAFLSDGRPEGPPKAGIAEKSEAAEMSFRPGKVV